MAQTIIIIMLALLSVGTIVMLIFTAKKHSNDIIDLMYMYDSLRDKYNDANEKISEINTSWSKSLDDREKSYNDIYLKCKKLEIELGEREAEIIKLQTKLYSINQSMHDTLKSPDSDFSKTCNTCKWEPLMQQGGQDIPCMGCTADDKKMWKSKGEDNGN